MLDTILTCIAILISLAAVIISAIYNRRTLKSSENQFKRTLERSEDHFKKTVQPCLFLWNESYEKFHKLKLKNGGTGPAIINKIELKIGNKVYPVMDRLFKENITDFGVKYDHKKTKVVSVSNHALVPNGEVLIFEYHFQNEEGRAEFTGLLKKIALTIYYKTIYDESIVSTEDPVCDIQDNFVVKRIEKK